VIEHPARGHRARCGVTEGQKVVLHQPEKVRRGHHERHGERDVGAGRGEMPARRRLDEHEQRQRQREREHEVLRPQRKADGDAQQQPMEQPPAAQRPMKGKAGQRPERQLNHVVIEFRRGEMQVMQAIDDEQSEQGAQRPDQRPRRRPNRGERRQHAGLRQRVKEHVAAEQPVGDLHQPPGQRRQLVVAELPLAAVNERLDQVERQVGIERGRQRRPQRSMQREKGGKGRRRALLDYGESGAHGACLGLRSGTCSRTPPWRCAYRRCMAAIKTAAAGRGQDGFRRSSGGNPHQTACAIG